MNQFEMQDRDGSMDDVIDLKSIIELLRRQIRLIFLTIFIVLGVALAYLVTVTPTFTAQTLVLFDPAQKNLLDTNQISTSAQSDNARIESEVEILRSTATALAVINRANLVADPEFGPSIGMRQRLLTAIGLGSDEFRTGDALLKSIISRFQNASNVRRRGLTYLISVAVTSEDPERAARLANTMAEVYIEAQVQAKVSSSLGARDILQSQINAGRDAVTASDAALDQFIETNLAQLEADAGNPELARLRAELEALRDQQLSAEVTANAAAAALEAQDFAALANRLGDQALADLAREREQLERQLGQLAQGSQQEIDLRNALAALEGDIEDRAQAQIGDLRGELSTISGQVTDFRADLRNELLRSDLSSESLAQIFELQQEAAIARSQYQTLLSRVRDLEAQAGLQVADSRIVSPALAPNNPSAPNTRLILALALVAGLGLGIGLAFLNEYYVGGITSAAQLRDLVHAPVATTVPLSLDKIDQQTSLADKVVSEPLSPYAESIRRLRASLDQGFRKRGLIKDGDLNAGGLADCDGRIVMITSTVPAEGKTTLALALARIYAISGKKTLLIDADLRKPSVHRQVGLQPEFGLIDYLKDPEQHHIASSFYTRDTDTDLSLVLGAGRSNVPTDQLISSTTFDAMLREARRSFDTIIIDTSPLVPVVDARYIAHYADAVVMPVRYATTSQADLRSAVQAVTEAMNPETDFYTVLSHQQYQQASYRYDGYYLGYGAGQD